MIGSRIGGHSVFDDDAGGPWSLLLIATVLAAVFCLAGLLGRGQTTAKNLVGRLTQLVITLGALSAELYIVNLLSRALKFDPGAGWALATLTMAATLCIQYLILALLRERHKPASLSAQQLLVVPPGYSMCVARTNSSVADYSTAIIEAEASATDLDYIQVRIPPYHYSEATVKHIANLRFGEGSANISIYMDEHAQRARHHKALLQRQVQIREIYPRAALEHFVKTGTHSGDFWPLTPAMVVDALQSWRSELQTHSNYCVAISSDSIPSKYHIISKKLVVLHDPVGVGDSHRLNSLFVEGEEIASAYCRDFELLWERTKRKNRDSHALSDWILNTLIPLALRRESVTTDLISKGG
ncbi:MAG: hypothetical protein QOE23_3859 [Pseudonocardiales bacterium]|jgi:hypothetical protein|nr:hypothetical protein [Pseudonocardiales bacterium]